MKWMYQAVLNMPGHIVVVIINTSFSIINLTKAYPLFLLGVFLHKVGKT